MFFDFETPASCLVFSLAYQTPKLQRGLIFYIELLLANQIADTFRANDKVNKP